jgi:quercetin dioxygenase-like cupin family protein
MALEVHPQSFTSLAEVLDDVKANGAWPTTLVGGRSEGLPLHWHDHAVWAYVMEGETDFLDGDTGVRIPVKAGDKIYFPAGALHAEGPVAERVVYVIAVPEPLTHDRFLKMRDPVG